MMQNPPEIAVTALEGHGDAVLVLVCDATDALHIIGQGNDIGLAELPMRGVEDHLDAVGHLMVEVLAQLQIGRFQTERGELGQIIVPRSRVIDVEMIGLDETPIETGILDTVFAVGEILCAEGCRHRGCHQQQKEEKASDHDGSSFICGGDGVDSHQDATMRPIRGQPSEPQCSFHVPSPKGYPPTGTCAPYAGRSACGGRGRGCSNHPPSIAPAPCRRNKRRSASRTCRAP